MNTRQICLVAACVAALSPVLANAAQEKASAQACASAFVSSISTSGAEKPAYKFAYRGELTTSMVNFYPSDYSFTLVAHDPKTGATLARAQCTTDAHGSVKELAALPLETTPATLAAAF